MHYRHGAVHNETMPGATLCLWHGRQGEVVLACGPSTIDDVRMMMKHAITLLAFFGLMSSPLAMAAIPAKINAIPGALIVNWQPQDAGQRMGDALEVYNDAGDLLARVPARMSGQQRVVLPAKTQGDLRLSLGSEQAQYRVPFGFGGGQE